MMIEMKKQITNLFAYIIDESEIQDFCKVTGVRSDEIPKDDREILLNTFDITSFSVYQKLAILFYIYLYHY